MKQNSKNNLSPRAVQLGKYNTARMNLLLVVFVTLINVILALTGSGTYFLFSAFIPYYIVIIGMLLCGKMPTEWYEGDMSEAAFLDSSFLVTMVVIAVIIMALYFVFWLLSEKQKSGWLVAALVFFLIDSLGFVLLGGISLDSILDVLFHAWVIYYLISGLVAAKKLKLLPPDEEETELEKEGIDYYPQSVMLKNGKQAEKVGANYFRGKEGVGGTLHFYNDRIVFKSHFFNYQIGNTTIRYADMTKTEAQKNMGIPNGLLIYTSDGAVHRIVVNNRDIIMDFINRRIAAFAYQE